MARSATIAVEMTIENQDAEVTVSAESTATTNPPITRRSFLSQVARGIAASTVVGSPLVSSALRTDHLGNATVLGNASVGATATPQRILVGSDTPNGILSFAWDSTNGTLVPEGIAAVIPQSTWLELSPDSNYLYVACELEEFEGQPTGSVASYSVSNGKLKAISNVSSTGQGTCHLCTDKTGDVVIAANYNGGSAASFLSEKGKLSQAVWSEKFTGHGPVAGRQDSAHAHFASVSPDNRFAYINDLGADRIHIFKIDPNASTPNGKLTPAGNYVAKSGDGPRTLHFLTGNQPASGKVAYCVNELNSTVTVLEWKASDGSLTPIQVVPLLPAGTPVTQGSITSTGCDAVLTSDGRFAYFANRGDDFLMSFHIDPATGRLTPFSGNPRTSCGGKVPRNFRLDPTERWMLVANQKSDNIAIFARNPKTGELSNEGKTFSAATPMCIVFV